MQSTFREQADFDFMRVSDYKIIPADSKLKQYS